ncbi:hypothetical protein CVH13_00061 [Dehalococcoides mccartyi]|uniref:Uncharacterized protein n=1 Tax=Dehalococcoides mccartyi TaxID=61435 RepID=A0A2J1E0M8_9CHLR|nr:hypothetical protein CVH13_00061 [Dehalococcoides mccartyi]
MKQLRTKCKQEIYQTGNHHYCPRYAIPGTDFCKFHNPESVAAKEKERELVAAEHFQQARNELIRQIIITEIFSGITTEEIRKNKAKLKAVFKTVFKTEA